jgi:transcriptional regulator with XRE-family HTH domain
MSEALAMPELDREEVARRVKTLRHEQGWSQVEHAKKAGVERTTINRIEHGRVRAREGTLAKLAKAAGRPNYFLDLFL